MNAQWATDEGIAIFNGNMGRALEISQWCKEHGMIYVVDFNWHRDSKNNTIIFQFRDVKKATWATLIWT